MIENTPQGINFINKYLVFWPGGKDYPDSAINSIGDTIFASIGWLSAEYLDKLGRKLGWHNI